MATFLLYAASKSLNNNKNHQPRSRSSSSSFSLVYIQKDTKIKAAHWLRCTKIKAAHWLRCMWPWCDIPTTCQVTKEKATHWLRCIAITLDKGVSVMSNTSDFKCKQRQRRWIGIVFTSKILYLNILVLSLCLRMRKQICTRPENCVNQCK